MTKLVCLASIFIFIIVFAVEGEISVKVFLPDGQTLLPLDDSGIPHVYQDIMVGTKLIIVVSSDVNQYWGDGFGNDGGSLLIKGQFSPYGILSAREPYNWGDWSGSHLPAAGEQAVVYDFEEENIDGFDFYTGSESIEIGDWFIIDYNAAEIGDCNVGFYNHLVSWNEPVYDLSFSQVRTRDFDNDGIVNFADFALFASQWRKTNCQSPAWCQGADLDTDGIVEADDLRLFCLYWLERTK